MRALADDGAAVLLTTHQLEEAEALCDRVGILSRGRLIALDSPARLKETIGEYVVEFIDAEGRLISHICKNREEAHERARQADNSVTVRKSNLEDVFMSLTGERM